MIVVEHSFPRMPERLKPLVEGMFRSTYDRNKRAAYSRDVVVHLDELACGATIQAQPNSLPSAAYQRVCIEGSFNLGIMVRGGAGVS